MGDQFRISHAAAVLHSGGVLAYPTEAVFGLGCDPHNTSALLHLLELKNRPLAQGFILLADSIETARPYFRDPGEKIMRKITQTWPGPVTWILPAADVHPLVTGGRDSVAIRVSSHPICRKLCYRFGDALVSTSANIKQRQPATNMLQLRRQFGTSLDGILNGPLGTASKPSQIIDARSDTIIRA